MFDLLKYLYLSFYSRHILKRHLILLRTVDLLALKSCLVMAPVIENGMRSLLIITIMYEKL